MESAKSNYHDNYQNIPEVFWDWHNQRVKIMADKEHSIKTLKIVKKLAGKAGISKIIAYVVPSFQKMYVNEGFHTEGTIKGFFAGVDAICFSYFLSPGRSISDNLYNGVLPVDANWDRVKNIYQQIRLPYITRRARPTDIPDMINLFKSVFTTYPSPVFDKDYLGANMKYDRVIYQVAIDTNHKIIGIASAEKDSNNLNAEITDCVSNPQFRGQGVLNQLIIELEEDLNSEGYICLYTLCRATHAPVNKAFFRLGYMFSGRLIKNCNICGSYEDMNILVKVLR
jgi:putative beta-lysine N-acetyltransferase